MPSIGFSKPKMISIKVVFPEPVDPANPTDVFFFIDNETPSMTFFLDLGYLKRILSKVIFLSNMIF